MSQSSNSPPPPPGAPAVSPRASKIAIASLICGVLAVMGLFPITSLPAVILGIIGIVKTGNPVNQLRGKGMAVAGLVLGVLGIALLPVFASIAIPAYNGIRTSGIKTQNLANMRAVSLACRSYGTDHSGKYPDSLEQLQPDYIDTEAVLLHVNPADTKEENLFLYFPGGDMNDPDAASTLLLAAPKPFRGKRAVAYVSGAVEFVPEEEYQAKKKQP